MGRRKFVAPLFETLVGEGEWGRPIAQRIYARARGRLPCGNHAARSTGSCAAKAEKSADFPARFRGLRGAAGAEFRAVI